MASAAAISSARHIVLLLSIARSQVLHERQLAGGQRVADRLFEGADPLVVDHLGGRQFEHADLLPGSSIALSMRRSRRHEQNGIAEVVADWCADPVDVYDSVS
ncbi:MAG: hypothetical protein R3E68_15015 [Burkholderiaceae bacterium]